MSDVPLPRDSTTELLCEACGYSIAGLPGSGHCPECGMPIRESLPESRPGSPWQRAASSSSASARAVAWLATGWRVIRHPHDSFRTIRADSTARRSLLAVNLLASGLLLALPWVGVWLYDPARHARGLTGLLLSTGALAALTLLAALVLLVLTWVECLGIRFFAARRAWRLTPPMAWQVCAHASIGWLAAGPCVWGALLITSTLAGSTQTIAGIVPVLDLLGAGLLLAAILLGMLAFEVLVYLGVRRCRFANAPRAHTMPA